MWNVKREREKEDEGDKVDRLKIKRQNRKKDGVMMRKAGSRRRWTD